MKNDLAKRIDNLPVKPKDLQKWILVGKVKLKAQIAAIKSICNLDEGIAAHAAALSDTQDLAEELLYAEARMGEMLEAIPEKKATSGGGNRSLPVGINYKQSHYAQTLSRNEPVIAKVVAEARESGEIPVRQHVINRIHNPSLVGKMKGNSENYTPRHIIDSVRLVLGDIDLDPASCEYAQKVVKAKAFYTQKDDGLSQPWYGTVFLNPPYGMPDIRNFTDKLLEELPSLDSAILLTNDQTDTIWWQKCARKSHLICFAKRIKFYTPTIEETAPTNGQSAMYFGKRTDKFIMAFKQYGLMTKVVE